MGKRREGVREREWGMEMGWRTGDGVEERWRGLEWM